MLFFETSAKNSTNINLMMLTAISKLPFFSQFDIDQDNLIKELEKLNCKTKAVIEEKKDDLQIRNENNEGHPTRILIKKKKKNCAC